MCRAKPAATPPARDRNGTSSVLVRNDILKLLYAGMLLEMSTSLVRRFWQQHPLPREEGAGSESELYEFLWKEDHTTDVRYVMSVLNTVEPFLLAYDIDTLDFIRRTFQRINRGLLISPRFLLQWGKPYLQHFFEVRDIRPLILELLDFFTQKLAPGIVHSVIDEDTAGEWNHSTIMLMHAGRDDHAREKTFAQRFPPHDSELWIGMVVQLMPHCMSVEPFEELSILGDSRTIEEILEDRKVERTENMLVIDDNHCGAVCGFHEFCSNRGLDIARYGVPDDPVVVAGKDYFCPDRERVVLHKGCAYGAPVCLYGLRYRRDAEKPPDFLSGIIDDATGDMPITWARAQERHEALLEELERKCVVVYHSRDDSISVNGRHLTRSVPARILRRIVAEYSRSGKTVFEYREFTKDENIVFDPLSPNLGVRLKRLMSTLEQNCPELSLTRPERGKLLLAPRDTVEYREEEN